MAWRSIGAWRATSVVGGFAATIAVLAGGACGGGGSTPLPGQDAGTTGNDGGVDTDAAAPEGGTPAGGRQMTTLATPGPIYALQIDAQNAYVASTPPSPTGGPQGYVLQVPLVGGAPITLAPLASYLYSLTVTAKSVYWPDPGGASSIAGVPIGGGAVTTIPDGKAVPFVITSDASRLYFADSLLPCTGSSCTWGIESIPFAGGTPTTLATVTTQPRTIAVDATSVYWGTIDGRVEKVDKVSGGAPQLLAYYQGAIQALAVGVSAVVFTLGSDILSTPPGGGTTTPLVVSTDSIDGLAVDGASVYWTSQPSYEYGAPPLNAIHKLPLAGGSAPELVWSGPDTPSAVQVDATSLYFATYEGALVKLSPK
jgi:hypothetical protein